MWDWVVCWWTVDFGDAHAGAVGVLVGGREPGPVYFDVGSGSDVPSTTHWSAYDGRARRPRAEAFRAVCACGWRSAAQYPLDWATIGDQPLYEADVDLSGPLADWTTHLSVVRDAAVPMPERLAALLVEMAEQLTATVADAPLAALRATGVLERIAARVGQEAAGALCDDGMSAEVVATALGTTRSTAQILLLTAQDR
ncbi:hypothetical protein [Streptomyces avidinii]|uniref:Uncharacterized protein n=1 Tax=Streptomyces avidinii TaxID=1895 RepID=A0ABS4KW19_STRAV|nr:hypothetical protein [Streptomyces avidinii]MBP2034228.1 hypothetical protein [Streptomyces avidinii]GGZ37705.1 hypothetical protein GCM10010343_75900 [Streptomyces avidinii]